MGRETASKPAAPTWTDPVTGLEWQCESAWSSTTFGSRMSSAWIVMFDGASVLSYYKTNGYYVRCLRG